MPNFSSIATTTSSAPSPKPITVFMCSFSNLRESVNLFAVSLSIPYVSIRFFSTTFLYSSFVTRFKRLFLL
jgi:hypothetical protein